MKIFFRLESVPPVGLDTIEQLHDVRRAERKGRGKKEYSRRAQECGRTPRLKTIIEEQEEREPGHNV